MSVELYHWVEIVRIRTNSGPYSVWMREDTDQNNSEYGHFSRSICEYSFNLSD